jgi:SAM-dependent methyltransferase
MNSAQSSTSWQPIWEDIFSSREWGQYPSEELIRFIARNYYSSPNRAEVRLLEIGCGSGANVWFMAREGFSVNGVDGSASAIAQAARRLENERLQAHLQVGDVAQLDTLFPAGWLCDAVIDICCLQHNRFSAATDIAKQAASLLKPGGKIFSILVSDDCYGSRFGKEVEPRTRVDISEGPLVGMGLVHFFSVEDVNRLFSAFSDLRVEYIARSFNEMRDSYKQWIVSGTKP